MSVLWFVIGWFVGAALTVIVLCSLIVGSKADDNELTITNNYSDDTQKECDDDDTTVWCVTDTHPCRFCKNCDHAVPGDDLGCYWCDVYGEVWGHSGEDCPRFTNVGK